MKNVSQRYVQRINARRERSGTLWEGRFYSCPVPGERYALACYRYVDCNPVKPGMVAHPDHYRWSSYRVNARASFADFVTPHSVYMGLGEDEVHRAAAYRAICDVPIDPKEREALRKATRRGYAAGTEPRKRGRPRKKMGSDPI